MLQQRGALHNLRRGGIPPSQSNPHIAAVRRSPGALRIGQCVRVSGESSDRKRRTVRFVQRYFLNPPAMLAVRTGFVPGYVLIESIGRRTGKRRRTVVGMQIENSTGWVVAEHGSHAGYVVNIKANPTVRVCIRGKWRTAQAEVVPDDNPEARLDGFGRSVHAANLRRFGTDLLTVRFDFARS
jgi:deazaflavin-dependent oxidoreductase (nitroreductase family)